MPELLGLPLDEAPNGLLGVDTISEKGDAEATAYAAFTLYTITAVWCGTISWLRTTFSGHS